MEKKTKTLIFKNISDTTLFTNKIKEEYDVNEVYVIHNNPTILFVIFYDIRESERCHRDYTKIGEIVYYTISKYELPREHEKCDKGKNQSTLFVSCKNVTDFSESMFEKYGEVKEIRNANPTTKCIEFFDSRAADKCYEDLISKQYQVKYVWDMSTKTKWEIIKRTDEVIGQQIKQKAKAPITVDKNIFIKHFDEFISDNIDTIYSNLL